MGNGIEIERKFLLSPLPLSSIEKFLKDNSINCIKEYIEQFYTRSDESGVDRYRRVGSRYIHTIKRGGGIKREEIEEDISEREYNTLRARASNIIRKVRCRFNLDNYTFELDIFEGELKGLNILEIEFDNLESASLFKIPDILSPLVVAEVTEDRRFTNGYLSKTLSIPKLEG